MAETKKRKADEADLLDEPTKAKRQAVSIKDQFREGLFDESVLDQYRKSYTASTP